MTEHDLTEREVGPESENPSRPRRRLFLILCGSLFAVLVLLLWGLWKRDNFFIETPLNYFVCTGTLVGQPLLAELNFEDDKLIVPLLILPDGTHCEVVSHLVESDRHVWEVRNDDVGISGTLSGTWSPTEGRFDGQLSAAKAGFQNAPVKLSRLAAYRKSVLGRGLLMGSWGQRQVTTSLQPRFVEPSRFQSVLQAMEDEVRKREVITVDTVVGQLQRLGERSLLPTFERQQHLHIDALAEKAISLRCCYRSTQISASYSSTSLSTFSVDLSLIGPDDVVVRPAGGEKLYLMFIERLDAERAKRSAPPIDRSSGNEKGLFILPRSATYSFERLGMRANFPPDITPSGSRYEVEFVVPWSELRPFLKPNGAAKWFAPSEVLLPEGTASDEQQEARSLP